MYKRMKRPRPNDSIVGKPSCASIGLRDNVIDEQSVITSNSDGVECTPKEKSTTKILQNVENAENDSTNFDNFYNLVLSCGMDITAEPNNILRTDQAVFICTLTSKLYAKHGMLSENVKRFMNNVKDYFTSNDNFFKALSPTMTSSDCDVARGSTQESLLRLLLQIEDLQPELSNYLLDKLSKLALQDNDVDSEITAITWVRLVLQPFRFLNNIVNSNSLCERLFDIIVSSSDRVIQQEIIICLPDIIADTEHFFAATELSKLLKCELELMPSALDALTNLSVQSDIRRAVRQSLIETLRTSPIEYLPNIVKFLLCTSDGNSYDEVIIGLRKELLSENSVALKDTISEENIDVETIQMFIFSNIRNCLLANKQLADAWTKNILQANVNLVCRPLDLIIIVILYDILTETTKKRSVETGLRNRIKNGFFTVAVINETFKHFAAVITEYFTPLMSILSKLLKSVDTCINEFVKALYLACFANTDQQWCKILIKELLAYIGAGDANDAQSALNILSEISVKYSAKINPLAPMLRVLLNKLSDISLNDVQQLMDMLCFIAFSEQDEELSTSLLKDSITKLIEKQINSSNIKLLRIGIVSAVMAIKHISLCYDEESNVSPEKSSEDFEESSLSEKAKKAVPFLRLIVDGTRVIPEAQGFGFDQLSLLLMNCRSLDKSLLLYISVIMKENMKKYFLICNDEVKSTECVECSLKFGLNEDEEFVVLNLTPTLVEELQSNASAGFRMYALVLPSLLRLIRGLEYEDLHEIDVLLECPVMVPAPKTMEEFGMQTPEIQKIIMDTLFYLTNWFREIVNCFARMIKQPAGKKVLVRLRTLIWLQNLIAKYLPQMLVRDYCPPKCYFHRSVKPPSIGNDKKKKKTAVDKKKNGKNDTKTTDIRKYLVNSNRSQPSIIDDSDDDIKENEEKSADLKNYQQFFRELDLDIWFMLSLPLTLFPEPEKNWEFKPEFGPSELLFIMEDLVEKIHFVLISSTKKNPFKNSTATDIGLTSSSIYIRAPEKIVKNMIKLIPRLLAHLRDLSKFCQSLLNDNDNVLDATNMFTVESKGIKLCYALILKSLTILFSWPGFEGSNNQDLFIAGLTKMSSLTESTNMSASVQSMIKECVVYLSNFQETILNLDCALNLVALIEVFSQHSEQEEVHKILGELCWNFLSHHWFDWNGHEEKGAAFNKNVEYLLTIFFNYSKNKLKAVDSMCERLKTEITTLNNKDSSLNMLPNINKGNCNILLRVLLKILSSATKHALESESDPKEKLSIWHQVMNTMESVVTILKSQPVRGSGNILRLFLSQGITVCQLRFRSESSLVTQILKKLQITTRYLQKIFDNTKLTEDSALCAYLPNVRSILESILLKVKNIMVLNGCTEAFFVGSMRNKDLQGQDILSQSTVNEDSERMDMDENEITGNDIGLETDDDMRSREENEQSNQNEDDKGDESDIILSNESDNEND